MARVVEKKEEKTAVSEETEREVGPITQADLKKLARLQRTVDVAKRSVEAAASDSAIFEATIMGKLKQGEKINRGALTARIVVRNTGRRPSWKSEFVKECGQAKADTVMANTPAGKSEKIEVVPSGQ